MQLAELTWSRVGDGWCRHGDGNANTAAAAVLSAAATPTASTEGGERQKRKKAIVLLRATCSDCTAGNTADTWTLTPVSYLDCKLLLTHQSVHIFTSSLFLIISGFIGTELQSDTPR